MKYYRPFLREERFMTNVFKTPGKVNLRRRLFESGVGALEKVGWKVERVSGAGKSSLRRITRDSDSKLVSIRTTQDTWIAFPRDAQDKSWVTLSEVDAVVAVSVDDPQKPCFANVHIIDGHEMRDRFDRAYQARKASGYTIPLGRGVWVSLYEKESQDPVTRVGAGVGLTYKPIARVPLSETSESEAKQSALTEPSDDSLSIAEAKRRLAMTFGVAPERVKIIIEA